MTDQRKDEMPELRSCSAMVTTMRDNPYPCNFPAKRLINGKYLCGTHSRTIKKPCADLSPPVPDDVAEAIDFKMQDVVAKFLKSYRLSNMVDDQGDAYPLIDALTPDGHTIDEGKEECDYIANMLSADIFEAFPLLLRAASTPSAEVQALREALYFVYFMLRVDQQELRDKINKTLATLDAVLAEGE